MAVFNVEGKKTVKCSCGNIITTNLNETIFKCPMCNSYAIVRYFGAVVDKSGDYVY